MPSFDEISTFETAAERDWPFNLGRLDWDDTRIVFTKRELVAFLKYSGITIDPNFSSISKLPRYAKFYKVDEHADSVQSETTGQAEAASTKPGFVPSRRVRDPPGGKSNMSNLLAAEDDDFTPPPKKSVPAFKNETVEEKALPASTSASSTKAAQEEVVEPESKPSQKRGWGKGFFEADEEEDKEFVPTRRVRERPGGKDNISEIW